MHTSKRDQDIHAVVLCAGSGRRLHPLTEDRPKCLLEIRGKTLLEYTVDALKRHGIQDIWIVSGFREDAVRKLAAEKKWDRIHFVTNDRYHHTNTAFSLHLALKEFQADFILLNGDVLFDHRILKDLLSHPGKNCVVVDDRHELDEEDVKVTVFGKRVKNIGKELDPGQSLGEAIGINKISRDFGQRLTEVYGRLENKRELQHFFEKGFDELCRRNGHMDVVTAGFDWIEIDTPEDFQRAVSEVFLRIYEKTGENG
ncbi:MAG: phosphocholine cytidylyltransferase family protein [Candidatus Aminicenantes bacterium]